MKLFGLPLRRPANQGPGLAGLAWLILYGLTSVLQAGDWPTYRHDNQRSGVTE